MLNHSASLAAVLPEVDLIAARQPVRPQASDSESKRGERCSLSITDLDRKAALEDGYAVNSPA